MEKKKENKLRGLKLYQNLNLKIRIYFATNLQHPRLCQTKSLWKWVLILSLIRGPILNLTIGIWDFQGWLRRQLCNLFSVGFQIRDSIENRKIKRRDNELTQFYLYDTIRLTIITRSHKHGYNFKSACLFSLRKWSLLN